MKRVMNGDDVKQMVLDRLAGKTQRALAIELGISPGKLNDYLRDGIEPSPSLLSGLGLKRVVCYRALYDSEKPNARVQAGP